MELEINCDGFSASHNGRKILLAIDGADLNEILEHFTIKNIIGYFDIGSLLEEIGSDEAEKHFDLIPNPEN